MKDISFVRTEMLPEQPAPQLESGMIKWLRDNMFSSVANGFVSVLGLLLVLAVLNEVLYWAILYAQVSPVSLKECREAVNALPVRGNFQFFDILVFPGVFAKEIVGGIFTLDFYRIISAPVTSFGAMTDALASAPHTTGACWSVIRERFLQLIYGFYPPEHYWRINVTMVLLLIALAPILFTQLPRKMLWFSVIYPALALWLLWGGSIWAPILVMLGFAVSFFVGFTAARRFSALGGIVLGIVVWVVWMLFIVGAVSAAITTTIAESRYDGVLARSEAVLNDPNASEQAVLDAKDQISDVLDAKGNAEALPELRSTAAALSAALPETVAGYDDVNDLPDNVSKEDAGLLDDALKAEAAVNSAERQLREINKQIGLFGVEPVESTKFGGFSLSLIIGITGIAASLPLGVLLALGRQSNLFIIKSICIGFIEFIRGVPLITLLFVASTLLNYFLPPGTSFDLILRVVIMVTFFASAYMAEVVRGGLAALPTGQYEAADALGLDYWKAQRLIIMPQALKISIPAIVSTFIGLFKDTTLVSVIGLLDPLGLITAIRGDAAWNGIVWELYAFVALMFFVICFSMSRYSMYLERKLQTEHR